MAEKSERLPMRLGCCLEHSTQSTEGKLDHIKIGTDIEPREKRYQRNAMYELMTSARGGHDVDPGLLLTLSICSLPVGE
jgi:hypothetical protein